MRINLSIFWCDFKEVDLGERQYLSVGFWEVPCQIQINFNHSPSKKGVRYIFLDRRSRGIKAQILDV